MMREKKNSLGNNLYHIFILSIGIPTIILSILIFALFQRKALEDRDRLALNLLNNANSIINTMLTNMKTVNESCYISSQAFDALPLLINPSLEVDPLRLNQIRRSYEEIIYKNMFGRALDVESVSFYPYTDNDDTPCFIIGRASVGSTLNTTYDFRSTDWFDSIKSGRSKSYVLYNKYTPEYLTPFYNLNFDSISIMEEVNNLNTNKPFGVMKTDVRASRLTNELAKVVIRDSSFLFIADNNKNIIASSSKLNTYAQHYFDTNKEVFIHGYDIFTKAVDGTPFTIYYMESKSDSVTALFVSILFVLILILVETEIGLTIYRRQSREIVKSVNSLINTMSEYAKGNLEAKAQRSSVPYLDNFALSLNDMAEKLQDTIDREYVAVINKQTAEYNALQSQINPHFFYNTLNGFIALNRMGEQKKLEKSIISLTKLFRYTCAKKDYVTVQEELSFVKEYLKIQKIKYEDRLMVEFELSDEASSVLIPRLILQPLVENSIVHGLEPVSRVVHVKVSAKVNHVETGDALIIVVSDDGAGCTYEELQLNKSVALGNIQRRIEIFSEGGILTSHCKKGRGVEVFMIIPLDEKKI
jgi:two-component system sensor histidine kinase YesM